MREVRIMSMIKEFKNIIENYWLIAVAPDYMQFLFVLMFDNNLYRTYLNNGRSEDDE